MVTPSLLCPPARGVLHLHACPTALTPHVEWAVTAELGVPARLDWQAQPVAPGTLRAEVSWRGRPGTAARLAARLRGWSMLRYEVTEEPTSGVDGERFSHVPALGLFRTATSANGDIVVGEDRLRALLATSGGSGHGIVHGLDALLGTAWDRDLEPYRQSAEGGPVTSYTAVV